MAKLTIRTTKSGTRYTKRTKLGKSGTLTRTYGAGKKARTTVTSRSGGITRTRSY